jgi:hypothetical protein
MIIVYDRKQVLPRNMLISWLQKTGLSGLFSQRVC